MMTKKYYLKNATNYDQFDSPVGRLTVITSIQGVHAILWNTDEQLLANLKKSTNDHIIQQTRQQLTEYFQGQRKVFDLPLVLQGTDFQIRAWQQLQQIPYGKTLSYQEQALNVGDKNKARAVGMANGRNPIAVVIPCHRVIGTNGNLVGFGGGIEKKKFLLNLEQNNFGHIPPFESSAVVHAE